MKNYSITVLLTAMFLAAGSHLALGQYDDLYFDPDRDGASYNSSSTRSNDRGSKAFDNRNATTSSFDDEQYGHYDDNYDYQYTSRIRRFHRPHHGFGYFDPVYVDMMYYDPFFMPGPTTVLIYDNFYSFNSWNRWNRWNRWNAFGPSIVMVNNPWNPWNPWNAWNPWNPWGPRAGFGFNTWGGGFNTWGGGFGVGGFGGGGFGGGGFYASNIYCPPSWGGGLAYNTVNNVNNTVVNNNGTTGNPGTYYGPRTSGTRPTATTGQRNIQGAQTDGTPRDVTSHAPTGRVQDNTTGRVAPAADGRTSQSIAGRDQVTPRSTATTAPSRSRTYDTAGASRQSSPATNPSYNRDNTSTRSSGYAPQSQPRRDYTPQAPSRSTAPATRSYDNNRRTAPSAAPRTAPSTAPRTAPSTAPRTAPSAAPRTAPSTSPSRSNWNSSPSRSTSPSRSSGSWNSSSSPSRSSSGFSSGSSPSRSSSSGFSSGGGSSRSSAPASRGRGN
jgi:uncharacterized membrane protein YgcG